MTLRTLSFKFIGCNGLMIISKIECRDSIETTDCFNPLSSLVLCIQQPLPHVRLKISGEIEGEITPVSWCD